MMDAHLSVTQSAPFLRGQRRNHLPPSCQRLLLPVHLQFPCSALPSCPCYHSGGHTIMIKSAGRLFRHRISYRADVPPSGYTSTSPASCSGVTVVSRHASQFVYTRPAPLRIMLAAYCPNNPSGAGKTMAPPLPHAALGAYPAQHRPDG